MGPGMRQDEDSHVDELDVVQAAVCEGLVHLLILCYARLEV